MSRADEILDASEERERRHPVAEFEAAVDFAEFLTTLDDRALAAVKAFAVEVGPVVAEALLKIAGDVALSLVEREISKRAK